MSFEDFFEQNLPEVETGYHNPWECTRFSANTVRISVAWDLAQHIGVKPRKILQLLKCHQKGDDGLTLSSKHVFITIKKLDLYDYFNVDKQHYRVDTIFEGERAVSYEYRQHLERCKNTFDAAARRHVGAREFFCLNYSCITGIIRGYTTTGQHTLLVARRESINNHCSCAASSQDERMINVDFGGLPPLEGGRRYSGPKKPFETRRSREEA